MKKIIILLIAIAIQLAAAPGIFAQWYKQSPIPTADPLKQLCQLGDSAFWILADNGTTPAVLYTFDGGATWVEHPVQGYAQALCFGFSDALAGFVIARLADNYNSLDVLKTTDGGTTWIKKYEIPVDYYSYSITKMQVFDAFNIYIYCYSLSWYSTETILYKTSDAGATWDSLALAVSNISDITFTDPLHGWTAGYYSQGVNKTQDGGLTWSYIPVYSDNGFTDLFFLDGQHGWLSSNGGELRRTNDGGDSWELVNTDVMSGGTITRMFFTDPSNGWAILTTYDWYSSTTLLIKTIDGGITWHTMSQASTSTINDLSFSQVRGYAVGELGTILGTERMSYNWPLVSKGTGQALRDAYFSDAMSGFVTGDLGVIFATSDGGDFLSSESGSDRQYRFNSVYKAISSGWYGNVTFAAGSDGRVFKRYGWGSYWSPVMTGIEGDYYNYTTPDVGNQIQDIWFHYDTGFAAVHATVDGWYTSSFGMLLKTNDAGNTWEIRYTGSALNGIGFADAKTGWAVGAGGTILFTSDGGETWKKQDGGTSQTLNKCFIIDPQTAWIVGDSGVILSTRDSGLTWQQVDKTDKNLYGIHFAGGTGWITGDSGLILKSPDGGVNWEQNESGTTETLYGVWAVDDENAWVVGSHGIMLHTTNGGKRN